MQATSWREVDLPASLPNPAALVPAHRAQGASYHLRTEPSRFIVWFQRGTYVHLSEYSSHHTLTDHQLHLELDEQVVPQVAFIERVLPAPSSSSSSSGAPFGTSASSKAPFLSIVLLTTSGRLHVYSLFAPSSGAHPCGSPARPVSIFESCSVRAVQHDLGDVVAPPGALVERLAWSRASEWCVVTTSDGLVHAVHTSPRAAAMRDGGEGPLVVQFRASSEAKASHEAASSSSSGGETGEQRGGMRAFLSSFFAASQPKPTVPVLDATVVPAGDMHAVVLLCADGTLQVWALPTLEDSARPLHDEEVEPQLMSSLEFSAEPIAPRDYESCLVRVSPVHNVGERSRVLLIHAGGFFSVVRLYLADANDAAFRLENLDQDIDANAQGAAGEEYLADAAYINGHIWALWFRSKQTALALPPRLAVKPRLSSWLDVWTVAQQHTVWCEEDDMGSAYVAPSEFYPSRLFALGRFDVLVLRALLNELVGDDARDDDENVSPEPTVHGLQDAVARVLGQRVQQLYDAQVAQGALEGGLSSEQLHESCVEEEWAAALDSAVELWHRIHVPACAGLAVYVDELASHNQSTGTPTSRLLVVKATGLSMVRPVGLEEAVAELPCVASCASGAQQGGAVRTLLSHAPAFTLPDPLPIDSGDDHAVPQLLRALVTFRATYLPTAAPFLTALDEAVLYSVDAEEQQARHTDMGDDDALSVRAQVVQWLEKALPGEATRMVADDAGDAPVHRPLSATLAAGGTSGGSSDWLTLWRQHDASDAGPLPLNSDSRLASAVLILLDNLLLSAGPFELDLNVKGSADESPNLEPAEVADWVLHAVRTVVQQESHARYAFVRLLYVYLVAVISQGKGNLALEATALPRVLDMLRSLRLSLWLAEQRTSPLESDGNGALLGERANPLPTAHSMGDADLERLSNFSLDPWVEHDDFGVGASAAAGGLGHVAAGGGGRSGEERGRRLPPTALLEGLIQQAQAEQLERASLSERISALSAAALRLLAFHEFDDETLASGINVTAALRVVNYLLDIGQLDHALELVTLAGCAHDLHFQHVLARVYIARKEFHRAQECYERIAQSKAENVADAVVYYLDVMQMFERHGCTEVCLRLAYSALNLDLSSIQQQQTKKQRRRVGNTEAESDDEDEDEAKMGGSDSAMRLMEADDDDDVRMGVVEEEDEHDDEEAPAPGLDFVSVLWVNVFRHSLALRRFDDAYTALFSIPKKGGTRRDCLQRMVVVLAQARQISTLCELSWAGMRDEVEVVLRLKARSSPVHSESEPNYSELLYGFLMSKQNYRKAAQCMFHHAMRLEREADVSSAAVLQKQANALLATINALSLVPAHPYILYMAEDASKTGGEKRKRELERELAYPEHSESEDGEKREVVRPQTGQRVVQIADVRKLYCLCSAHLRLAEIGSAFRGAFLLSTEDTRNLLLQAGLFDSAFALSRAFGMELDAVFQALVEQCLVLHHSTNPLSVRFEFEEPEGGGLATAASTLIAATKQPSDRGGMVRIEEAESALVAAAWDYLHRMLQRYDSEQSNFRFRVLVAKAILDYDERGSLPQWLVDEFRAGVRFSDSHIVPLLRLYASKRLYREAGRMVMDALEAEKVWLRRRDPSALRACGGQESTVVAGSYLPLDFLDDFLKRLKAEETVAARRGGNRERVRELKRLHAEVSAGLVQVADAAWG